MKEQVTDISKILQDMMEDMRLLRETVSQQYAEIMKYCCPIKINRKLCISLPNGVAAALLIQGLGFQFQTVSIIKCAYFDKESL